ncbi:MAG: biotin/lipoyl-binding protein [Ilumatobacteraceae bacterium]|jgi:acetyl/propionyl-CoA carboxylase alpha subunit|nr:biotin/lipoyl-binding protein [Ilumatobacteraceae bacterium]
MALVSTLLIANRGEIACRIARTCRRLGIRTVAVHSDADAGAMHVRACDAAVALPGSSAADTYLRAELLVDAARRAGADAVHPGYGFLAENAGFAQAVIDAGLTWIGPPPAAITAMGSKVEAKLRMRAAGVPVLPDSSVETIEEIGFPLLVKASAGGGGRGMRIVRTAAELDEALAAAGREATSAFGDGTVFCERYVERGRHVEIQVLADRHGGVAALPERECSIQRRHQKIVEESPSPAVGPDLRTAMQSAAVAAAREVGYEGAGTVEFLLAADGTFAFLEMNTRLQVEHPVTEAVTGLDLVEWQIAVAEGRPLGPEVTHHRIDGWAVEARLTAEDPAAGYQPATGTFTTFEIPDHVRVDTGVEAGSVISPYYDSMVAKVIAHAPTRETALRALRTALRDARLHGPTTNRDQLVRILEHPDVVAGDIDTELLDRVDLTAPRHGDVERAAAAAAIALATANAAHGPWAMLPAGWRNNPAVPHAVDLRLGDRTLRVEYDSGRAGWLTVDGSPVGGRVTSTTGGRVTCDVDGLTIVHHVVLGDGVVHVDAADGAVTFQVVPRFVDPSGVAHAAGSLVAPMPGSITRLAVAVGHQVTAGQVLLALEAMKMEHQLHAPAAGTVVAVHVEVGDQVDGGQALLVIEDGAG